ncbi:mannosyl-oligosaccharide glucosidase-like [Symsagittifera roscoffensis]|uniref:mannosyl-oligosaccharide glucosidase-like n=1 Tax=Symsagittifera roscoffensis TaxID=84072 RepID=UPI00307BA273
MTVRRRSRPSNGAASEAGRIAAHRNGRNSSNNARYQKWFIFGAVALALCGIYLYNAFKQTAARGRSITPFREQILDAGSTTPSRNSDLFWGAYRPGVYFGMKTRSNQSPVFGLLWLVQFDPNRVDFRHNCDQGLKLPRYGWISHDGVSFGYQEIVEKDFVLNVSFVKRPHLGIHGGDWTARVQVSPHPPSASAPTQVPSGQDSPEKQPATDSYLHVSLFFYTALDGQGEIESVLESDGRLSAVRGYSNELGYFDLKFEQGEGDLSYHFLEAYTPSLHLIKEAIQHYSSAVTMKNNHPKKGQRFAVLPGSRIDQIRQSASNPDLPLNLIVSQVSGTGAFSIEAAFESASHIIRKERLVGDVYSRELGDHLSQFHSRFEHTFRLREKGFSEEEVGFAEAVFSNLIGGMGYFYGASAIQTDQFEAPLAYWYTPLFTAVPSRSFFPRGFLWDEGFHQLSISRWNSSISLDVLAHWMDLMNAEGWIPREQILGSEALARVPREFIVQHTSNANPPSFLLTVDYMLDRDLIPDHFLRKLYPKLLQWVSWYNTTQTGPIATTFQWKGRNTSTALELNPKSLSSGLDDYPRASHPSPEEYHVDLRCWMALTAQVLTKVSEKVSLSDVTSLSNWRDTLTDFSLLKSLHWSNEHKHFTDIGTHSHHVTLVRPAVKKKHPQEPDPQMVRRVVESVSSVPVHVPHLGYVSLFPLMMRLMPPDCAELGLTLGHIRNPNTLWTPYGIRSLSKQDPLYMKRNTEHDPPYWRGQIWVNMNYMLLRALHHYSQMGGPHAHTAKQIYSELRNNLIQNIFRQYQVSGFVWENYNDLSGKGQGAHPFTGWTSLVLLLMAEDY